MTFGWSGSRPSFACWRRSPRSICCAMRANRPATCGWSGSAVSAISTGFGIWATHFVAMLAFTPGIPSGYNIALTVLSLVAAILLTGVGLAVSLHSELASRSVDRRRDRRRRHRRDALHRHGRIRHRRHRAVGSRRWSSSRSLLAAAIGAVALPVGLHGTEREMEDRRRAAADAGDLLPSLHRDGRGVDHSRSAIEVPLSTLPDRLAGAGGRARELRHHRPGAGRASCSTSATRAAPSSKSTACATSPTPRSKDFWSATARRSSPSIPASPCCAGIRCQPGRRQSRKLLPGQGRASQAARRIEPDGRNQLAPSRRCDDAGRTAVAPDRFRRTAASCRRGARPAGPQGSRAAHPLTSRITMR